MAADQINVTEGSGKAIATETVSSKDYQLVKLVDSTSTSTTRTGVAANPLQVSLANTGANSTPVVVDLGANNDVTVTGTVTVDLGANNDVTVTSGTVTVGNSTGASAVNIQDGGNSITIDGTITANAGTNLNTSALALESGGNLAGAATSLAVMDDWDNGASDGASVSGDVAHDTADAGEPVKIGARATNSIEGLTQVANADRTNLIADLNGALVTRPYTTPEEILSERVTDTGGTSTAFTTFAAGGAGVHNYITTIAVYNSSATDGYVDFRDGTGGAVRFTAPLPTLGGSVITFPVPLKFADNTAVAYDVSGALSTVYISVVGYQAQG